MLIIVGLSLMVVGLVARDLALASIGTERARWRRRWADATAVHPRTMPLGDRRAMARLIGNPNSTQCTLDRVATELAAHDSHPSERLLDQLRIWARSHILAEVQRGAARVGTSAVTTESEAWPERPGLRSKPRVGSNLATTVPHLPAEVQTGDSK